MSTQDMKKLSTVLRSIDTLEENINAMHKEFTESVNGGENSTPLIVNDQNVHLQIFFQHLEQLLQTDLKNRMSLLNNSANKKHYWNFFSQALKDSKGLYDTIAYVLNSQEVTTPTGRGRLFIRFCLQNHRLGDVMQHSFRSPKTVSQFYNDECFWSNPTYLDRIVQALYTLNELQFDLLSNSSYQLDVSWPIPESMETRLNSKNVSDRGTLERTSSVSSFTSMISDARSPSFSIPNSTEVPDDRSLIYDDRSLASADEDPENTLNFWKEKYFQLEANSKPAVIEKSDVQIQCAMVEDNREQEENQRLKRKISLLQKEIQQLNERISSISATNRMIDDFEGERRDFQKKIEAQETRLKELQTQLEVQNEQMRTLNEQTTQVDQDQQKRVETLQGELEKSIQSLENERKSMEEERKSFQTTREQLEAAIEERTLDFDEMKRRLVKAIREKAELFNTIHSYEIKLEEEQSRKWMEDDEASACLKCNTAFGWTLRKHHCRHCQKIYCYYCSNNWISNPKTNSPQYRVCDFCNDKLLRESLMPSPRLSQEMFREEDQQTESVDTRFEVRAEKLTSN